MPDRFVLDSFALLALLQDEPGAPKVQELLNRATIGDHEVFITVVNLGEVLYTTENRRGLQAAQEALAGIDQSPIRMVDVDRPLTLAAARLKAATGVGYADCFAAALAQQMTAAVVTGDRDFGMIEGLDIEWLPAAEPQ